MAGTTITKADIIRFSDKIHVDSQQMQARLRGLPGLMIKQVSPGAAWAYDGLGIVEAEEENGRFAPVVFSDIEHKRRKIGKRRWSVTLPIDAADARNILLNPNSEYSGAGVRAMERVFDRVGIEAALADVLTGRDFETTTSFATDGGLTVTATAGSTYEKLLELIKNYDNNEVDYEGGAVLLATGTEKESFMQELELISSDFRDGNAPKQKGWMMGQTGIRLLTYGASVANPMLSVASGVRSCIGLVGRGLCYGMSKEFTVNIEKRTDLIETTQVQIIGELGAVRTEGLLVQKFTTTA